MAGKQILPNFTRGEIGLKDVTTSQEEIAANGVGRKATPQDTPIFICQLDGCNRLYPSRERLAVHRKRDHISDDAYTAVLTWNRDIEQSQEQMQE
ncbi:hypothetical protein CPB86DRAFT_713142 [Serendipita vermifera]|nr:hypothetical protein CPB86DRAFT_713142 [Serendipita vermifera]